MTKKSPSRTVRDGAARENDVFLDLVDALLDRGAVEITAGPFHVKFQPQTRVVVEESTNTTSTASAEDVAMEYWSAG